MENASRDLRSLSPLDQSVIARTAVMEAQGEGAMGVAMVIGVMLNRLESDRYPDEVWGGVVTPGAFSTWRDEAGIGHYEQLVEMTGENDHYRAARVLIEGMVKGQLPNPVPYVTHYANETKTAGYYKEGIPEDHWINTDVETVLQYGEHTFYINSLYRDEEVVAKEVDAALEAVELAQSEGVIEGVYTRVLNQEGTPIHKDGAIAGRAGFPEPEEEHSSLEKVLGEKPLEQILPAMKVLEVHEVQVAEVHDITPASVVQKMLSTGIEIG